MRKGTLLSGGRDRAVSLVRVSVISSADCQSCLPLGAGPEAGVRLQAITVRLRFVESSSHRNNRTILSLFEECASGLEPWRGAVHGYGSNLRQDVAFQDEINSIGVSCEPARPSFNPQLTSIPQMRGWSKPKKGNVPIGANLRDSAWRENVIHTGDGNKSD